MKSIRVYPRFIRGSCPFGCGRRPHYEIPRTKKFGKSLLIMADFRPVFRAKGKQSLGDPFLSQADFGEPWQMPKLRVHPRCRLAKRSCKAATLCLEPRL